MKKKVFKVIAVLGIYSLLTGFSFGCYDTREEAWAACNDDYNGKCRYLGPKYEVCPPSSSWLPPFLGGPVPCTTDSDCEAKNGKIE